MMPAMPKIALSPFNFTRAHPLRFIPKERATGVESRVRGSECRATGGEFRVRGGECRTKGRATGGEFRVRGSECRTMEGEFRARRGGEQQRLRFSMALQFLALGEWRMPSDQTGE
jgi:hypothetical protein